MDQVILVNEADEVLGAMDKMEAHRKGVLHRAFSLLLFNNRGEILLQKRALTKYHSAGLWTNACCSHPHTGEDTIDAVIRRTKEEIGLTIKPRHAYSFIYKTNLDNGLIEHELDHVFVGISDEKPIANPAEVADWKYISLKTLRADISTNPEKYTYWFRQIMNHQQLSAQIPVADS